MNCVSLPPVTKLRQGNVFTRVCQSFCSQGWFCVPACTTGHMTRWCLCPGGSLSGRAPPMVTRGRYASCWNAFLFAKMDQVFSLEQNIKKILESGQKYWKRPAILSVRKSGNDGCKELCGVVHTTQTSIQIPIGFCVLLVSFVCLGVWHSKPTIITIMMSNILPKWVELFICI